MRTLPTSVQDSEWALPMRNTHIHCDCAELSMVWVDPSVGSRFFSFQWVGCTRPISKVLIFLKYGNALKARLDKIWLHQAVKFDFMADLTTKL